ncbi:flagellar basal body rod protein FlgB [Cohnella lubricantis]|uniref:Flagellar basal body rod protein FlgB n=1 Tax=Cohnella lubricantis TaxID=2163172 RepID=A0A841TLJ7_9BACL|nr:flagellar basal body rod protein FlgB [Cohnella lubricantis]MBB6679421.1 flagellar basal body rod protein FlgB [Cohnella lubricantis]MBP2117503.1 flagellar basal-body rod protein FlgB [Cohnella lubricantis]
MDLLGGASFQRMEAAIKASSMRQQVLANNIANVDTPNFKRSDVQFEELLSQAMGSDGSLPDSAPAPRIVTDESTRFNNNKNNVDIDKEMALLAENQLRYNLFAQQINHDIKMMNIAIKGQ